MQPTKKHYKYLFLSMSCNDPFFEMSRRVVHDTWARDLIDGKYPDCGFYSYTSGKKEHIEDNCIYVNVEDDIHHTYSKTIRALQLLKENDVTWDVIVRTNTSTYINVRNMIDLLVQLGRDSIYSFGNIYFHDMSGEKVYIPLGWMMILPSRLTDILISRFDEFNESHYMITQSVTFRNSNVDVDDAMIGIFTYYLNNNESENIRFYKFNNTLYNSFRTELYNKYIQPGKQDGYVDFSTIHYDPRDILNLPFLYLRKRDVESKYRYIECEQMYEIHNTLKKYEQTL